MSIDSSNSFTISLSSFRRFNFSLVENFSSPEIFKNFSDRPKSPTENSSEEKKNLKLKSLESVEAGLIKKIEEISAKVDRRPANFSARFARLREIEEERNSLREISLKLKEKIPRSINFDYRSREDAEAEMIESGGKRVGRGGKIEKKYSGQEN